MSNKAISKGDPLYDKLLQAWINGGRQTWVTLSNGQHFKAITPSDDVVVFKPHSSDSLYGSLSGTPGGSK